MSISRPSMQNIPRLKKLRDAFIPREGNKLVLTDYQAQETRLIAHFAREEHMIEAFKRGEDIHRFVASMVYSVAIEDVIPEQRRKSKQCGHARNYGANAPKLALTAGISLPESKEFARRYDHAFPRIQPFNMEIQRAVRERDEDGYGYLISYSGRKIRVPVKKAYVGTNYLIQGSGSDALKKGLVNADRAGIAEYAVLPVHDEIVWDIPEEAVADVIPEIRMAFEHTDLLMPLPIETKIIDRWGDAYE
jgi:DNA polymerase-1